MSKLDKEKVLAEFIEAYKKAHGKEPKIESSSGWYSVDGGKNVRLAQLAEEAEQLTSGKADKPAAKQAAPKKAPAKKSATKKPAASKAKAAKTKTVSSGKGLTAKELWKQKLEKDAADCRLPRGS